MGNVLCTLPVSRQKAIQDPPLRESKSRVRAFHFPCSDLDQIWYAASLGEPKNRLMTAFSIRAPGALLQVHHGLLGLEEDLPIGGGGC